MKELFANILSASLSVKIGIAIGVVVSISGLYYFLLCAPVMTEVASLSEEISGKNGLKVQISSRKAMVENLDHYRERVRILDIELSKALQELPDKKAMDLLLSMVSAKARDAGLEVRLFRPGGEKKYDFYAALPIEIEVMGTFHQLATFFDEVGHMERIVNLDSFDLANPESMLRRATASKGGGRAGSRSVDSSDGSVRVEAAVIGTAFRFLEESDRPQPEQDANPKRRGKKVQKDGKAES